jgi:hypothetical protein
MDHVNHVCYILGINQPCQALHFLFINAKCFPTVVPFDVLSSSHNCNYFFPSAIWCYVIISICTYFFPGAICCFIIISIHTYFSPNDIWFLDSISICTCFCLNTIWSLVTISIYTYFYPSTICSLVTISFYTYFYPNTIWSFVIISICTCFLCLTFIVCRIQLIDPKCHWLPTKDGKCVMMQKWDLKHWFWYFQNYLNNFISSRVWWKHFVRTTSPFN